MHLCKNASLGTQLWLFKWLYTRIVNWAWSKTNLKNIFFFILHHLYLSRQHSSSLILFWIGNHKKFCLAFKRISFKTQILFQGYFYIFPLRIPNHNWEFIYFRLMALCIQFHHTFLGLCKGELKKVLKWINLIQLLIWNWSDPNTNHHFEQCRM